MCIPDTMTISYVLYLTSWKRIYFQDGGWFILSIWNLKNKCYNHTMFTQMTAPWIFLTFTFSTPHLWTDTNRAVGGIFLTRSQRKLSTITHSMEWEYDGRAPDRVDKEAKRQSTSVCLGLYGAVNLETHLCVQINRQLRVSVFIELYKSLGFSICAFISFWTLCPVSVCW